MNILAMLGRPAPTTTRSHRLMILVVSVLGVVASGPVDAGDRLLIEAATVSRDGRSLVRVIPTGRVVMSNDVVAACGLKVLDPADVLVFDIDAGTCDTVPANHRRHELTLVRSAHGHEDLDDFDTTDACLQSHHAALVDDTTGLATCFRWFDCDEIPIQVTGPAQVCSGDEVILDAGPGFESYLWSPGGETTQTILVAPWVDTEYLVEVTDEWACTGADTHWIEALPLPEPVITGPADMCMGETVMLDAGGGWTSYAWSSGAATQTVAVSPVATTEYWVTVSDAAACHGTSPEHVLSVDEVWEAELFDQTIGTDTTVRTCGVIWVGPGLEVTSPAHLGLQAGGLVVLRNGVVVESGSRLTVRLEADLNSP